MLAQNLAHAFLDGDWSEDELVQRGMQACGASGRWFRPLVRRVLSTFSNRPQDLSVEALCSFLEADKSFHKHQHSLILKRYFWTAPDMRPEPGLPLLAPLPALVTTDALADWLGLSSGTLLWFADCQGREAKVPSGPLRHYTYHWLAKTSGKSRLLEAPKGRLKAIQRRLLAEILTALLPHQAAHGFRAGRSIGSYVTPHVGQRIVLRMDLRHFFPSIGCARIQAIFRTAGYPPHVAQVLAGLCTNVVPEDILSDQGWKGERRIDRFLFQAPHLPQGAPTSPYLANLSAYRLDCRLTALAEAAGARYTRYADDLAFSGGRELERAARRFQVAVGCIALEEGYCLNTRKSRFMRQAVRQQLAGIVVNVLPNIQRADYDRLKAILCNCVRHGPQTQNRTGHVDFKAHLLGRLAYVGQINPRRGGRLRELFEQIRWDTPPVSSERV